jgi:SAM-dependent methyltransferase
MDHRMQWRDYRGTGPELYERYMVPAIFAPWADDLVARAALRSAERVLDMACGTGVVARSAAQRVGLAGRVVAQDISAGMLARARALPAPAGAPIEWYECDVAALPFADATFDVALCQQGLQFFPDRAGALREMRRVLAADGRVVLSVFCYSRAHFALADALVSHVGPGAAASLREPFTLRSAEELANLLAGAGFRDVTIRHVVRTAHFASVEDFVGYLLASRLAGAVALMDDTARAALLADARAALADCVEPAGFTFPMEAHLAHARV